MLSRFLVELPAVTFFSTVVCGLIGVPIARNLLRKARIVDQPNARSSHRLPTARGGGIVIIAIVVAVLSATVGKAPGVIWGLTLPASLVATVSFIDDIRALSVWIRLATQFIAAGIAVGWLHSNGTTFTSGEAAAAGIVATCWIVGFANAFNFMDGINGIAGTQAVTTGLGTAAIALAAGLPPVHPVVLVALAIAGAALGFLPYNFPTASVFMGDVGSATLGFLLAALAVWTATLTQPWVLVWIGLLHANFILDTAITLARRAARGERVYHAHREHFYQRLVRAGASHSRVTLTESALQTVIALLLWRATSASASGKIFVGVGVILTWLVFFALAEAKFVRALNGTQGTTLPG